jgi:hypothetical protein
MADTLTKDLRRQLEALHRSDPDKRLNFVVTLRSNASAASIAAEGMVIDQQIADPPLLLGTMTPKQALAVARLDNVKRIELDAGGVHALGKPR